jgi:hypothetical protein
MIDNILGQLLSNKTGMILSDAVLNATFHAKSSPASSHRQ